MSAQSIQSLPFFIARSEKLETMPIPTPDLGEKENDFISRCMSDSVMHNEYPDSGQRSAICHTQWAKKMNDLKDYIINIYGVEVFKEGTHNGDKYTATDINDIVSNFKALESKLIPKVKITHKKAQKTLAGLASYGDVVKVYADTVGGVRKLFVDIVKVPEKVADWIKTGRFAERSIEVFRNVTIAGKKFKNVLAKVTLLGHEIPAVSGMSPVKLSLETDLDFNDYNGSDGSALCHYEYKINNPGSNNFDKEDKRMPDIEKLKSGLEGLMGRVDGLTKKLESSDAKEVEQAKAQLSELSLEIKGYKTQIEEAEKASEESGKDIAKLSSEIEDKNKEIADYKKKDAEKTEALRKEKIDKFVGELKKEGRVVPAFENDLKDLLYSLDSEEKSHEYKIKTKEGDVETKLTQYELAEKVFSKIAKLVKYGEIAPSMDIDDEKGEDTKTVKQDGETYNLGDINFDKKVKAYQNEHKCNYLTAYNAVAEKSSV